MSGKISTLNLLYMNISIEFIDGFLSLTYYQENAARDESMQTAVESSHIKLTNE